jgi:hypothetical protein
MFGVIALSLGLAAVLSYLILEFPRVSISADELKHAGEFTNP